MKVIEDWFDFVCIIGLDFLIIVTGTWILPQIPNEDAHIYFALAILASACYFTKKAVEFIGEEFSKLKSISISDIFSEIKNGWNKSENFIFNAGIVLCVISIILIFLRYFIQGFVGLAIGLSLSVAHFNKNKKEVKNE